MIDIVVIGAGPAGLMASLSAVRENKSVLLLEKNEAVGKKLKLTGGGRCNVTNNKPNDLLIKQIKNGKFLYSALNQFNASDIEDLFLSLGVELKEEEYNRVFPTSNKSTTIINALIEELNKYDNFKLLLNEEVVDVIKENGLIKTVVTKKRKVNCKSLILTTGGKSMPKTGSTGFGHMLAIKLGHSLTELYPTETPLLSRDQIILNKSLQGISLKNVGIKAGKFKEAGYPIIFTHFGLSGPAALRSSDTIYHELKENEEVKVSLDFFPELTKEELKIKVEKLLNKRTKNSIKQALNSLVIARLQSLIYEMCDINENENCQTLGKQKIRKFVNMLKNFEINIYATRGYEYSYVTGGGVNLKEVSTKKMQSKIVPNLYFAGEVLDLHAHTGGYNITIAFSTGFVAGKYA